MYVKNFISFITEPYPDELLYSWIIRLANTNEMPVQMFYKNYFEQAIKRKQFEIPVDIRRGYLNFYNSLHTEDSPIELYLKMSTLPFEALAFPPKLQIKLVNNIFRKESRINLPKNYFIPEIHMCKECMKEDVKQFGELYIHRSHQLSGVCVCHKHHTPLFSHKKNSSCVYDYEKLEKVPLEKSYQEECEYADYSHKLLDAGIQSNSNDIVQIIFDALGIERSNKKEAIERINQILKNRKPITSYSLWSRNDSIFPIKELLQVLQYLYPNPEDLMPKINEYKLIVEKHCDKCGKVYYTTEQAIIDGWGCTFCDDELDEKTLIRRLIKIGGNNAYSVKRFLDTKGKKNISLHHKDCSQDFEVSINDFVFRHTRCKCGQNLQRKEAEKRMKKHPGYELLQFSGASHPATFLHKTCGNIFEKVAFRDFEETPKCPHCDLLVRITPEVYREKVKALVGDEYTVIDDVFNIDGRVNIRHNKCGDIQNYKAYDFLLGSRCTKCYSKASDKKLKAMLIEYADDRYEIIGKDKHRIYLYDHVEKREIRLFGKQIVQELLRPTPSPILPTDKCLKIEKALNTFDHWYMLCEEYKKEFGNLCVGRDEKYQGHALGYWCSETRIAYNKRELPQEQIDLLNKIDFVWDAVFYYWNKRFEEYKEYVKETNNYFPPVDCIYNGNKVGQWFLGQRKERKRGRLNPTYEKILLEYNPEFFKERNAWDTRYARMKEK